MLSFKVHLHMFGGGGGTGPCRAIIKIIREEVETE